MEDITQFLADCWKMFTDVQVPILNISFASLYLGVFVVCISIVILRPLLGIGFGSANNIFSGIARVGKRGYDNAYRKRQQEYNQSYEKYSADRRRNEDFAARYKKERQS